MIPAVNLLNLTLPDLISLVAVWCVAFHVVSRVVKRMQPLCLLCVQTCAYKIFV